MSVMSEFTTLLLALGVILVFVAFFAFVIREFVTTSLRITRFVSKSMKSQVEHSLSKSVPVRCSACQTFRSADLSDCPNCGSAN